MTARVKAFNGVRSGGRTWSLPELLKPPQWVQDALCAETDPDAFYPDKGGSTRAAKLVCAACPVRELCLSYALEHRERYGIWGGLSERERRRLMHKQPGRCAA